MPGAGRWTAFLVLALTIAGISAEAWGADGSLVLPELTVTAPPFSGLGLEPPCVPTNAIVLPSGYTITFGW